MGGTLDKVSTLKNCNISADPKGRLNSYICLTCPPQAETTAESLGWLLYASVQAGCHQGGHGTTAAAMVEKCIWQLILLVFCV
jgi:hypothetical protein